jgi:hypothetical protein
MYVCARGIVPGQNSELSCKCVLGVLYQARTVSGHISVCYGYCTKPEQWAVIYVGVRGIVPSQNSEPSCRCVLGVLYQARTVSDHVSVR